MNAEDLTGRWQGIFNYPRDAPSTGFVAVVEDASGVLTGETAEPGLRGGKATARLDGRREGAAVTFVKLYDADDELYDSVSYEGTVRADGQEITGRWSIPGAWTGTFIMVREEGVAQPVEAEVEAEAEAQAEAADAIPPE